MDAAVARCGWCGTDPLYVAYHDQEWGVPSFDDAHLFEMLILEGQQAGLSWITVLKKRAALREAFEGFDPERMARFTPARIDMLLTNPAIIRNRIKIEAAIGNARALVALRQEVGPFAPWLWQFVGGAPIQHRFRTLQELPTRAVESDMMSKALKQRGFRFVGSTICYALMQAVGMVNDHLTHCHRYRAVAALAPASKR